RYRDRERRPATRDIRPATKGWDEEFKKSVGRTAKPNVYGALLEFYPFNCSFWGYPVSEHTDPAARPVNPQKTVVSDRV
ncbi:MAG TPA: hypothetical protein PK576_05905, partial [Kiritimatiellia bacterium]|nr:hypothetical protein [Kiritimatiellia bacterium]